MILKNKISVLIQCYNQEHYISDCIKSVLAQNQEIIGEILIFDDNSTDNTPQILKEICRNISNIKLFLNSENIGAFSTFKLMHQRASFEYVAHLDGDDIWDADKLIKQYQILEAEPKIVGCGAAAKILMNNGAIHGECIPFDVTPSPSLEDILDRHPRFILSSLVYRNHIFSWDELSTNQIFDWALFLLLRSKGPIQVITTPLLKYRIGVGISTQKNLYDYEVGAINLAVFLGVNKKVCELKYYEILINRFKRGIKNRKFDQIYSTSSIKVNKIIFIKELIKYICRKIIR